MREARRAQLRGVERRAKALAIRAFGALARPRSTLEPPDWSARPHRVLYLRYDRIGDMVLATGIIKAIQAAQPTITVDVLASIGNADVLRGNPRVGTVYTIDKARPLSYLRALARIRRVRYDAVVDAMVMAPSLTTMLLMWGSGAPHRIGVADRGNEFALTVPVSRLQGASHYVDHSAAVLAAFGVDPEHERPADLPPAPAPVAAAAIAVSSPSGGDWGVWRPEVFLAPEELSQAEERWRALETEAPRGDARARLLVNVSAGADWRYWPDDRFIATLTTIRARFPGLAIVLVGAPEDLLRMTRIGDAAGVKPVRTPHYRQMMALVARADFVLTADTSVTHVASAFGKPAVVLFGRNRAALYGPYGTPGRVVSTAALSLDAIDVGPVVQALGVLLAAPRSGVGAHP